VVSGRTSEVDVRRLRPDDASSVSHLLRQLGYPANDAEVRRRIEAWTADDRGAAFGATIAHRLVGCAAVYVVPFFERPGSRARLVALVVDEAYRQRGLGSVLVKQVREFARLSAAVEIEVTSRRERTDAQRFYSGAGFADVTDRSRRYIAQV
jgi:GNAT superfamily N-acetyltransferase